MYCAPADGASALAGFILGARPGEVVLDMCAVSTIFTCSSRNAERAACRWVRKASHIDFLLRKQTTEPVFV